MSKIIKETSRKLVEFREYKGTCDACGSYLEYEDALIGIDVSSKDGRHTIVPIDILSCPNCFKTIEIIYHYDKESLDVTDEIKAEEK